MCDAEEESARIFQSESLPAPRVVPWPLGARLEALRIEKEKNFQTHIKKHIPAGLEWMGRHTEAKYNPARVLPGCRSILVFYLEYYRTDLIDQDQAHNQNQSGPNPPTEERGRIARYARGRDYHKELGYRLRRAVKKLSKVFPDYKFKAFTDIGPLDEVWLAETVGLGFRGRHGLVILNKVGSWVVLGHILSTMVFPEYSSSLPGKCPVDCRRCIDACPTGALTMPGLLNADRCISCQTIERSGPIPEDVRRGMGNWVFGCDVCQEVCPFNRRARETNIQAFKNDVAGASKGLADLLSIKDHADLTRRFAGSPLMRAGRDKLVRNACTAAGNSGQADLIPVLRGLFNDEDEGVRNHARWAVDEILQRTGAAASVDDCSDD